MFSLHVHPQMFLRKSFKAAIDVCNSWKYSSNSGLYLGTTLVPNLNDFFGETWKGHFSTVHFQMTPQMAMNIYDKRSISNSGLNKHMPCYSWESHYGCKCDVVLGTRFFNHSATVHSLLRVNMDVNVVLGPNSIRFITHCAIVPVLLRVNMDVNVVLGIVNILLDIRYCQHIIRY